MASSTVTQNTVITNHRFSVASLDTVNFDLIRKKDQNEIDRLLRSARTSGFFYLDLRDDSQYLLHLQALYRLSEAYFDQPQDVKLNDYRETQERGYKPGDAETFEISRDELVQKLPAIPQSMKENAKVVEDFISASHTITLTLLSQLSDALWLDGKARFEHSHREGEPSDCGLKLESVPLEERLEDVPPSEHTDMGTLTLLYCPQYTTEIQVPGTNEWGFIVPKPGHAIVNVADSLQTLSKGELRSSLHRVGQPTPGAGKRFCLLYYLRPEFAVLSAWK